MTKAGLKARVFFTAYGQNEIQIMKKKQKCYLQTSDNLKNYVLRPRSLKFSFLALIYALKNKRLHWFGLVFDSKSVLYLKNLCLPYYYCLHHIQ